MRKFLTLLWLLFPVAVLYYHFNQGPKQMLREKAHAHVARIQKLEKAKDQNWEEIIAQYDQLMTELPVDEEPVVRHEIRLAKAKARLEMLDIAGAVDDLTILLQECAHVHGEEAKITRAVRETLGKAHYYAAYVLKTSGAPEEEWRPYAERTRQLFRFLAEHQDAAALSSYEGRVEAQFQKTVQKKTP